MSTTDPAPHEVRDWEAVQSSPEFQDLRHRLRSFGLLQFVSTFAITIWYVRYANRRLDPLAEQLRDELEGGDRK